MMDTTNNKQLTAPDTHVMHFFFYQKVFFYFSKNNIVLPRITFTWNNGRILLQSQNPNPGSD